MSLSFPRCDVFGGPMQRRGLGLCAWLAVLRWSEPADGRPPISPSPRPPSAPAARPRRHPTALSSARRQVSPRAGSAGSRASGLPVERRPRDGGTLRSLLRSCSRGAPLVQRKAPRPCFSSPSVPGPSWASRGPPHAGCPSPLTLTGTGTPSPPHTLACSRPLAQPVRIHRRLPAADHHTPACSPSCPIELVPTPAASALLLAPPTSPLGLGSLPRPAPSPPRPLTSLPSRPLAMAQQRSVHDALLFECAWEVANKGPSWRECGRAEPERKAR